MAIWNEILEEIGNGYLLDEIICSVGYDYYVNNTYLLKEGLIKTYPIDKVMDEMSSVLHLSFHMGDIINVIKHYQTEDYKLPGGIIHKIKSVNDTEYIEVIMPQNNYNKKLIDKYLNKYGWFTQTIEPYMNGDFLYRFRYEKRFDIDVSNIVDKKDVLYHVTSEDKLKKIYKNGIVPREDKWSIPSEDILPRYRVYFFINEPSEEDIIQLKITNPVILKITTEDIKNLKFYADPRMRNAVYTTENIPPKAIRKDKKEN